MKTIFKFLILPIFFVLSCQTDREKFAQDTTVELDAVYDFGEVMQGEVVKAKFEIKNTGDVPLKIFEVKPTCGCTLASFTEEAVDPGKSAWVEAEVDTKGMFSNISKTITVMANTQPTTIPLKITGIVLSKDN